MDLERIQKSLCFIDSRREFHIDLKWTPFAYEEMIVKDRCGNQIHYHRPPKDNGRSRKNFSHHSSLAVSGTVKFIFACGKLASVRNSSNFLTNSEWKASSQLVGQSTFA